jgi:serine/threonine protein kinase
MMKCNKCNVENPDNTVNCKNCGAVLEEETKPNTAKAMETVILDAGTRLNIDPLSFSPGEKFGERYQIIEEIGQGGMGRVFKAKDLELDTIVALKMIKPQLSSDPDIVTRFKRELLLAREILHDHVIRIHDLGEINSVKYISMNYIQGNTLKEILQSTGKLTVEKTIDILNQVCSALIAAHSKGIIHRDLKPQNIMIDKGGTAYVLDFGIARSLHLEQETAEEGVVLGTPDFMSPEQIKGEKADVTTDIYSLGIILYEMVTGKLPFAAKSSTALLHKHLHETPEPPSKLNPQVPLNLERITLKCMEKKKKNRYQSVKEILQDLELDKTIELTPVKMKKKKESRFLKPFFKVALRVFVVLLILYAAVSLSSLVNDSLYKVKIEKLQVEYDTYYKSYFPLKKEWLPAEWEIKNCNSWDTYLELFPPKTTNPLPGPTAIDFQYKTLEKLKQVIANYEQYYHCDRLFEAVKCSELDSYSTGEKTQMLYLPMIRQYMDMIALEARLDFWEGNYEAGLTKLYNFMVFTMDLFAGSTHVEEQEAALLGFNRMCREIIPLLLSGDTNSDLLSPHEIECRVVFGDFKEGLLPFADASPPLLETGKIDMNAHLPLLLDVEKLIHSALTRFEPRAVFYKEYLNLVKNYHDIYGSMGMDKTDYHLVGKLKFWNQWFSLNRYFYKEGIEFYQELFEGMKYIRDMHDKSAYINDYFEKHASRGETNRLTGKVPRWTYALNVSRTFAKLVSIIIAINRYGPEAREFLNLKGTDLFINELTGTQFELSGTGENISILLDKDFKLDLKTINYGEEHQHILQSFAYVDK